MSEQAEGSLTEVYFCCVSEHDLLVGVHLDHLTVDHHLPVVADWKPLCVVAVWVPNRRELRRTGKTTNKQMRVDIFQLPILPPVAPNFGPRIVRSFFCTVE